MSFEIFKSKDQTINLVLPKAMFGNDLPTTTWHLSVTLQHGVQHVAWSTRCVVYMWHVA